MKNSLKAASLVEALVAAVIFMTVFIIAMDSMTNIARINFSAVSPVEVENAVKDCMEKFEAGTDDRTSYEYSWGKVEIKAETCRMTDALSDVTLVAKAKNGNTVIYRYLTCRNSIQQ
ncbi:MAG: hypothetical protein ACI3ZQ_07930 [Candidatus Cryptobacteroides sp.]